MWSDSEAPGESAEWGWRRAAELEGGAPAMPAAPIIILSVLFLSSALSRPWGQLWAPPGPLPISRWSEDVKGRLQGVIGEVENGARG